MLNPRTSMPIVLFLSFHDQSMDYLYGSRNLNSTTLLDDYFTGNFVTVFMSGIIFFMVLRCGLQTTSLGTPFYLHSGLGFAQGIQFSTDH